MSNKTSLTNFMTVCNRGLSRFRQPAPSLVLIALLCASFGQALLFCQPLPPPQIGCSSCCAGRPTYTGILGQMAVATMFASGDPVPLGDRDLVVWNISPPYPPANSDWATLHGDRSFSDPRWNVRNLGDVFGLTLDSAGNIYVSAT